MGWWHPGETSILAPQLHYKNLTRKEKVISYFAQSTNYFISIIFYFFTLSLESNFSLFTLSIILYLHPKNNCCAFPVILHPQNFATSVAARSVRLPPLHTMPLNPTKTKNVNQQKIKCYSQRGKLELNNKRLLIRSTQAERNGLKTSSSLAADLF